MTEPRARLIYRAHERWSVNWTTTRGDRRNKELLAQGICGIYRGSPHRLWSNGQRESRRCGECARVRGARPWGDGHRRAHPNPSWQSRYSGRSSLMAGVYPRRWYLLNPEHYPIGPSTNHGGKGANPSAARQRREALHQWSYAVHCTIETTDRAPDRRCLG
jgi:hypothetical protein